MRIMDRFAGMVAVGLINSDSSGSLTLSVWGQWVGLLSTMAIVGIMDRFAGRVAVGLIYLNSGSSGSFTLSL